MPRINTTKNKTENTFPMSICFFYVSLIFIKALLHIFILILEETVVLIKIPSLHYFILNVQLSLNFLDNLLLHLLHRDFLASVLASQ